MKVQFRHTALLAFALCALLACGRTAFALAPVMQAAANVGQATENASDAWKTDSNLLAEVIAADLGSVEKIKQLIEDMRYDGFGIAISPVLSADTKEKLKIYFLNNKDADGGFNGATKRLFFSLKGFLSTLSSSNTKTRVVRERTKPETVQSLAFALAEELTANGWFKEFLADLRDFDVGAVYSAFVYDDSLSNRMFWYFKRASKSQAILKEAVRELRLTLQEIYRAQHPYDVYRELDLLTAA